MLSWDRLGSMGSRLRGNDKASFVVEFFGQVFPALAGGEGVEFVRRFQHQQFAFLQHGVAGRQRRALVADGAQLRHHGVDQRFVLVQAADRAGKVHIHVDRAVTFVEDTDRLGVVGPAGAVGGLEGAAELDVGVFVHRQSIHQNKLADLRQSHAALHRRTRRHRRHPALDVVAGRQLLAQHRLHFLDRRRHPRIGGDVGDAVFVAGQPGVLRQLAVHHAEQALRLIEETLAGQRGFFLGAQLEEADLAQHRPQAADLPVQPFQHLVALRAGGRQQLAGLLGQVGEDGAALENAHRLAVRVGVDDGGNLVVGRDGEEGRLELRILAEVDGLYGVRNAQLFEHDGNLAAVRRGPGVEREHGRSP